MPADAPPPADSLSWKARYDLLREVGDLCLSDLPDDELLRDLTDKVVKASAADGAVLVRPTGKGDLEVVCARSYLKADIAKPEFEVSRSIIQESLNEGRPVFVENALLLPQASKSVRELRVLSVIALPLHRLAGEPPFAVLYLDRRRPGRLFSQADLDTLADVFAWCSRTLEVLFAARKTKKGSAAATRDRGGIVGSSQAIVDVLALVEKASKSDANVLIRGETGTGKELVAQLLHQRSAACSFPFVAINCAAIPGELLESELFGHEAGSFTGATARRIGRMQEASGGSLFLDEIGDMPPALQAKILRAVEGRKFTVVGGKELPLKARIVSATHQPLEKLIKQGKFRQDLYYRLAVLQIDLPPLRKRREDILPIAEHFVSTLCRLRGRIPPRLTRSAQSYLLRRAYPGNVRELSSLLERALLWSEGSTLDRGDLVAAEPPEAEEEEPLTAEAFRQERDRMVRDMEMKFVEQLLKRHGGNVAAAARAAGLSEVYIYRLLKRHKPPPGEAADEEGDEVEDT